MTSGDLSTPRVSIITPVFDPEPGHLAACLDSVQRQTTGRFEHILIDDGSTKTDVVEILAEAAARPSVRLITRTAQGGIVAATNDGLDAATGDFVAFLDHDDVLRHDAIETMLAAVDRRDRGQRPGTAVVPADVVYSDHDFLDADGEHLGPCLKPEWSPERLRNQNYITHFVMARRSLVDAVGGLRTGFDGAQDHDLMLRMGERARRIAHVPEILYHWRQAPTSVAAGVEAKPWAFDAGQRAVAEHCERIGLDATVAITEHEGIYRIERVVPDPQPLVSVLIPTRGSSGKIWGVTRNFVVEAVRSVIERSTYTNLEFVVVVDDDTPPPVITALLDIAGDRLTLVDFHEEYNFSKKMNVGAAAASGELLLFLNDDTELIEPSSIETLVGIVHGPAEGPDGSAGEVGMAGAKLLFDDGTIQHGGHVYFYGPHHACTGWSGTSPGPLPMKPLAVERECSGVTAAVAVVRKDVYDEVGGFPEELPLNYNDVDFSLKIRASGRRIIWSPHALWYHFESRTRVGKVIPEETAFLESRWAYEVDNDPYYNPQLSPLWFDWLEWPIDEPMQVGVVREPPAEPIRRPTHPARSARRKTRRVANGVEADRARFTRRKMREVGVVVTTNEGAGERLDRCLASLRAADDDISIVVVDNSGRGEPISFDACGSISHVVVDNRGFGAAVNAGVADSSIANLELVAVVNDDVVVSEGWLRPLVAVLDIEPEVGAVQPKLVLSGTEPALVNSLGVEIDEHGAGSDLAYRTLESELTDTEVRAVDIVTGGACVCRRSFLENVGGFDERLFLYYEDVDLCLRGAELGWKFRCAPASRVEHDMGASTDSLAADRVRLQERNRLITTVRFAAPRVIVRAVWLSMKRLRHEPRAAHRRALLQGVARMPRAAAERFGAAWRTR